MRYILIILFYCISIKAQGFANLGLLLGDDWTPLNLSPTLYLSDQSGITQDANGKITHWIDEVSGIDFAQADTSLSPSYTTLVVFDGTDDYMSIADFSGNPFDFGTSDFTIETWIYLTATGIRYLAGKYVSAANSLEFYTSTYTVFVFRTGSGVGSISDGASAPYGVLLNGWHHIVVTLDRDVGIDVYVDNINVQSEHTSEWTDLSAVNFNNDAALTIGVRNTAGSQFHQGSMAVLRTYTKALTTDEITKLYNYGRK